MLWTLLTVISSASFLSGAVIAARLAKAGVTGYILVLIGGLELAVLNAWALEKVADVTEGLLKSSDAPRQERWLGALYVAVAVWPFVAVFLSRWVFSAVFRLAG